MCIIEFVEETGTLMNQLEVLKTLLQTIPELELAVLVGSRASGSATIHSDWDIAIRWEKHIQGLANLKSTEALRRKVAKAIHVHQDQIDFIDIPTTQLTMRAVIAEEGIMLKGDDTLAWAHFLTQTWGELEDYYWRKNHAS